MANAIGRERGAVRLREGHSAAPGEANERWRVLEVLRVRADENRDDAWHRRCRVRVDGKDLGVRPVAAQKVGVQLARQAPVVRIATPSRQQPVVLPPSLKLVHGRGVYLSDA